MVTPFLSPTDLNSALTAIDRFYSTVHEDIIGPIEIAQLDQSNRDAALAAFPDHQDEIQILSKGGSLYRSENLNSLRMHVKRKYWPCASHGQFVEGGVKDTALTGQTGAEERRRNNMSVIRSHTVSLSKQYAVEKQEHKNEEKEHRPHGSKFTASLLDVIESQFKRVTPTDLVEAKKLMSQEHQFKSSRQESRVKKVIESRSKSLNTAQKRKGVTYTPSMLGMQAYGPLNKKIYIDIVIAELAARSIVPPDGTGIRNLVAMIKADEIKRNSNDSTGFHAITDFSEVAIN